MKYSYVIVDVTGRPVAVTNTEVTANEWSKAVKGSAVTKVVCIEAWTRPQTVTYYTMRVDVYGNGQFVEYDCEVSERWFGLETLKWNVTSNGELRTLTVVGRDFESVRRIKERELARILSQES